MSDGPGAATSALFLCPPPKWPLLQPWLSTSSLLTPMLSIFHVLSQSHSPPFPSLCLGTDLYKPPPSLGSLSLWLPVGFDDWPTQACIQRGRRVR